MKIFNLYDTIFSHEKSIIAGKIPKYFEWANILKGDVGDSNSPTFYSHEQMFVQNPKDPENSYGLLFESQLLMPGFYKQVESASNKFKYIFTYNKRLIDKRSDKFKFIPAYCVWENGAKSPGQLEICSKTKNLSMIASDKQMTYLQCFRKETATFLKANKLADVYGKSVNNEIKHTREGLQDYRFSIAIENAAIENYFTEKLLNCFALGTLPVYLGCRNIKDFFNTDGIIFLNDLIPSLSYESGLDNQIASIFQSLNEEFYLNRMPAIKDNFERCKKYQVTEDYLWENYFVK